MKLNNLVLTFATALVAQSFLSAEAAEERMVFGKWRVAIGGAFNGAASADVSPQNIPQPGPAYAIPLGATQNDAWTRALNGDYDVGFIHADSEDLDRHDNTENWRLPSDPLHYDKNGNFTLENAYESIVGEPTYSYERSDRSDDPGQFGFSAELAREVWIHDEEDEHRWGIDVAAAFSYFFPTEIYNVRGSVTRTDTVESGRYVTEVHDSSATFDYDYDYRTYAIAYPGMLGNGVFNADHTNPTIMFSNVDVPTLDPNPSTRPESSALNYSASGEYQELEIILMARPWYEITDWWRVYGNLGIGVSWGRFNADFNVPGVVSASERFEQWDVYGVGGLGTMFRYREFDISVDVFGRFLRDDMDIDGRYAHGTIERGNWGVRVMVGYEF